MLDRSIKRVLVIGSGPIVIGQAAEFDYAGTQACRALKEDNIEIVLINSNPATIMTDSTTADKIYIEPLTLPVIKKIIELEKPDSILSGLGGQTGLNLCMQLARDGFLEKNAIRLLGASPETIDKAEDRQLFKDTMNAIKQPVVPSLVVTCTQDAVNFATEIGYPIIVRPAFTLGGSGGGIAQNKSELREISENGLRLSPIHQILVERCVSGWKEIEFEVIRDNAGNVITVCSMENVDPVGIHTGDSVVVAPALTLSDKEYQMLRTASLEIITAIDVHGGCNVQFALNPSSFEYAVIEVNPRVSRSSALASKATGYPIAKVAAKIALGYNLDEIVNAVTGKTFAAFEPTLDYVAVKFPKWAFDKFVYAKRELGTQMKATGEVMSISDNFESALMKAVRGLEIGTESLTLPKLASYSQSELETILQKPTDERLFAVYELIKRNLSKRTPLTLTQINNITKIDMWFLSKLKNICQYELSLSHYKVLTDEVYFKGKQLGFTDNTITRLTGQTPRETYAPLYRMVDTCGGEFEAVTPYFYASYFQQKSGAENEAAYFKSKTGKKTILIIGSGPIRIGQGIEFDYASVHCVRALKKLGYDAAIINNNPETVSTDFDTANRLYFEPLNIEDVMHVVSVEDPFGVIVSFGGGTAVKLAKQLAERGVNIIGTSAESIDICEERYRFDALLTKLNINRPRGFTATKLEGALSGAQKLGFPVLMRPSYVLGGQNMIIARDEKDIIEYMGVILSQNPGNNILIDKYLSGTEVEVDALCDGKDVLIPGIMEHVERTGVHSGDSIAVYPPPNISDDLSLKIFETTEKLCLSIGAIGLVNIQYIIYNEQIYVIEVNPRASRTVPYLSKVANIPICEIATRCALGEKLSKMGYSPGIYKKSNYIAVKVPVFSFEKLTDVDTQLGPEMKSTGEVLGIATTLTEALYKGFTAAGYSMDKGVGGLFVTVADADKDEIASVAAKYAKIGFTLYATEGTGKTLLANHLPVSIVSQKDAPTFLDSGKISFCLSTSAKGRDPLRDSVKLRRKCIQLGIPCLTSLDTASAVADCLAADYLNNNLSCINLFNKES